MHSFLSGIFKKSTEILLKVLVGFFVVDCFLLVQTGVRKNAALYRPFNEKKLKRHVDGIKLSISWLKIRFSLQIFAN